MIIKANWLTKFLTKFLFLLLGLLVFSATGTMVLAATENITQVNFVTEPQTILPNTISDTLTIQTQNSIGGAEPLGETADVFLESTSGTGEFSSSKTNWLPDNELTMNNGWANRSFYYRDATEGSYTLTATIKTRIGGQSWTTTQTMVVSVSGGSGGDGGSGEGDDGDDNGGDESGHSGQSELSDVPEATKLAVGAGRSRLTTIGSPVIFKAITSSGDDQGVVFTWSFGDGGSVNGEQAEHTYQFPGTYVVVVNAYRGEERAVARTTVRVIDPQIAITAIDPTYRSYIELSNPSADEVNLMSWRLYAGEQYFVFPTDTILPPNSKIKYPLSTMYLPVEQNAALTLRYPNGWEVATRPIILAPTLGGSGSSLEPQPAQLVEVAKKLALIKDLAVQLKSVSSVAPATVVAATDPIIIETTPVPPATTTGSTTVIELAKPSNLWRRIYELF